MFLSTAFALSLTVLLGGNVCCDHLKARQLAAHDTGEMTPLEEAVAIRNQARFAPLIVSASPPEPDPVTLDPDYSEDGYADEPSLQSLDPSACAQWPQEDRFVCEHFPDMPGECCLGC